MTYTITHRYVSAIPDSGNTSVVQPSDWNDEHVIDSDSVFDVKLYGAAGDTKYVTDAVLNSGTTVTSATANFAADDVGKTIYGMEIGAPGFLRLPVCTITARTNSTTIQVSQSATSSSTGIYLVWGTNDTTALRDAAAAALAAAPRAEIVIPAGGYLFDRLCFDFSTIGSKAYPAIRGAGALNSAFYPLPTYNFGSISSGEGILIRYGGGGTEPRLSGISVHGMTYNFGTSNYNVIDIRGPNGQVHDVKVSHCYGIDTSLSAQSGNATYSNCWVEDSGYRAIYVNIPCRFINCYTGNSPRGIVIATGVGPMLLSGTRWIGGLIDECPVGSVIVETSDEVYLSNTKIWSADGAYAIDVTGATSVVQVDNCIVGPYAGSNNRGGIINRTSGGIVRVCGHSRVYKSGTKKAIDNTGTVYLTPEVDINLAHCSGTAPLIMNISAEAADVMALKNSTTAQTLRIYNTFTDASNYERGLVYWTGNVFTLTTQGAGTGANRGMTLASGGGNMIVGPAGFDELKLQNGGAEKWTLFADGSLRAISGNLGRGNVVTKAADFTLAVTENWVVNNKSGSSCTVTMPSAGSFPGREVHFQNNQAQTLVSNASNIVPKGGGAATAAILPATATAWAVLVSDGTNWVIMMSGT